MNSLFTFQFGEFADTSPNWFDWISLIASIVISILSILGGFWIATAIYSKEKVDKDLEENEIQASEVRLFKNSLSQLSASVISQITSLEQYKKLKNFSLEFDQGVHVDFLLCINIKYLYKEVGVNNIEQVNKINQLLSSLYSLNDFRIALRDELRSYMTKYSFHEDKFYMYKKILYTKYFELCNLRGTPHPTKEDAWTFNDKDLLMIQYSQLRCSIYNDDEVILNNVLQDREKLIKKFINPLIESTSKLIPKDHNAIEIFEIANQVNSSFEDMKLVTTAHFKIVGSYLSILEDIRIRISEYLKE